MTQEVRCAPVVEKLPQLGIEATTLTNRHKIAHGGFTRGFHPMSRRYWLPIIAAVGLALASRASAKSITDHGQGQTQANAKLHGVAQPSPPVTEADIERLASALKAANTGPKSAAEQQQAIENLKAQQAMAAAAQRMFWVGLSEALFTFSGVVLVWFTLHHTRRAADAARAAVDEAKRGANAAENNILETRRIGEAQTRAYVTITDAKLEFVSTNDDQTLPVVTITAENAGQSLAKNFVWGMTLQIIYGIPPDLHVIQKETGENWESFPGISISAAKPYIDSGTVWGCPLEEIPVPEAHELRSRFHVSAKMQVKFIYKDVFDKTFCQTSYFSGRINWSSSYSRTLGLHLVGMESMLAAQPEMVDWIDHNNDQPNKTC